MSQVDINTAHNPVLIYGATGGIGQATARTLHARGYPLHLCGRDEAALRQVAGEVAAGYTVGDVTDRAVLAKATESAGPELAGLVFAVGTLQLKPLGRVTLDDFLTDFTVNAAAAALAIQAAVPALKKNPEPSSVVLYSSVAASMGFRFHSSIAMAKGAVEGLTRTLAAELAPSIRVNAVAPSLTQTALAAPLLRNDKAVAQLGAAHPMRRLGAAADVAALTTTLIGPESGWITGQVIGVDGGRSTVAAG
ncbi:MAG: SDR family oxidoreductase [Actinomycetia bacterium]|nr:SDR family oxidoreductase [Actinomycetes bacterium]